MNIPSFEIPSNFKFISCDNEKRALKVAATEQLSDTIVTYRKRFDKACTIPKQGDFVRVIGEKNDVGRVAMNVLAGTSINFKSVKYSFPVNEWIPLISLPYMDGLMVTGPATVEYGMLTTSSKHTEFVKTMNLFSLNRGMLICGEGLLGTLEYYRSNESVFYQQLISQ